MTRGELEIKLTELSPFKVVGHDDIESEFSFDSYNFFFNGTLINEYIIEEDESFFNIKFTKSLPTDFINYEIYIPDCNKKVFMNADHEIYLEKRGQRDKPNSAGFFILRSKEHKPDV